ncbi:MAG: hypothetical protein ACTIJJ_05650 [Galactobacter sp.]
MTTKQLGTGSVELLAEPAVQAMLSKVSRWHKQFVEPIGRPDAPRFAHQQRRSPSVHVWCSAGHDAGIVGRIHAARNYVGEIPDPRPFGYTYQDGFEQVPDGIMWLPTEKRDGKPVAPGDPHQGLIMYGGQKLTCGTCGRTVDRSHLSLTQDVLRVLAWQGLEAGKITAPEAAAVAALLPTWKPGKGKARPVVMM